MQNPEHQRINEFNKTGLVANLISDLEEIRQDAGK